MLNQLFYCAKLAKQLGFHSTSSIFVNLIENELLHNKFFDFINRSEISKIIKKRINNDNRVELPFKKTLLNQNILEVI